MPVERDPRATTAQPCSKGLIFLKKQTAYLSKALILHVHEIGTFCIDCTGTPKPLGRPATPAPLVARIEGLAATTPLSIRQIHAALAGRVSRSVVGEIVKRIRAQAPLASL